MSLLYVVMQLAMEDGVQGFKGWQVTPQPPSTNSKMRPSSMPSFPLEGLLQVSDGECPLPLEGLLQVSDGECPFPVEGE